MYLLRFLTSKIDEQPSATAKAKRAVMKIVVISKTITNVVVDEIHVCRISATTTFADIDRERQARVFDLRTGIAVIARPASRVAVVIEDGAIIGDLPENCDNPEDWGIAVIGRGAHIKAGQVVRPNEMIEPYSGR